MKVEQFFKTRPVLETKISVRNLHLDPDDPVLFAQTTYFRIIKHRLKLHDEYITYFTTDYHSDDIPDDLIEAYETFIEYFKEFEYPHKLVLNLINLEKDKAIVGTFLSANNEIFSFRFTMNSDKPDLIILTAYYTTEQTKLILEDFIQEFGDYINNIKDKKALKQAVNITPTGEIQPNVRVQFPFQPVKKNNKNEHKHVDYTYL